MSTLSAGFKQPQASQAATIGLLLSGGALAALWVGINLIFPGLAPTGIPSAVTRLAIHFAILAGLWLGLSRTEFSASKRFILWLSVAIPFTLWLAVVWNLAVSGAFQPIPGVVRVPRLPIAIFAPVIIGLFVVLRSKSIATFLDAMPGSWLIALQVYRIFGGIFIVNWVNGTAPGIFAWPAGIGDMLTGITALPVALLLASVTARARSAAITWNIFGLCDFAVAITMGILSSPGPLQIFGFEIPASLAGTYPTVMIPAFAVPSSILLHALSIRQLRRIERRENPA
ncbi:MAG: MFS transporter [Bradyrhizobium sp.]|uniref:hypothetical protein n=1 Tax=Bradyrhizobium sp. TaxID=376 RepID=UPI00120854E8|nr:hypothetical protein [Bradyrhizobium sp.]THD71680.1 MAG: MFS transporter [Bradyrhizobium sp.]